MQVVVYSSLCERNINGSLVDSVMFTTATEGEWTKLLADTERQSWFIAAIVLVLTRDSLTDLAIMQYTYLLILELMD